MIPIVARAPCPRPARNSAAGGLPARSHRGQHRRRGDGWCDAATKSVVSRRTISAAKWLRMKHCAARAFVPSAGLTFRIPPTSTMATMILAAAHYRAVKLDTRILRVCRVGRTNNLIHHSARSKAVHLPRPLCRLCGFDRPSPIPFPHNRHNMNGFRPLPHVRSDLHRFNRGFATVQNGCNRAIRSAAQSRPHSLRLLCCWIKESKTARGERVRQGESKSATAQGQRGARRRESQLREAMLRGQGIAKQRTPRATKWARVRFPCPR